MSMHVFRKIHLKMEQVLLSEKFLLYPKKCEAEVNLTASAITVKYLTKSNPDEVILLSDVIGCHLLEGNRTTRSSWYLCVFSYPLRKKALKGLVRQRVARSFGVASDSNTSDDKKVIVEQWKQTIQHLIAGEQLTKDEVCSLRDRPRRNLIVYVNPFSGRGKAMQIYENHVKPMFAEAEIQHQVVKTEYPGHARVMAKELLVEKHDGIVIVSGDGLIHEVLNGLMERGDWERAIETPIGIVPGGSGNALAASVAYASARTHPPPSVLLSSIIEICRGRTRKLDLMSVEMEDPDNEGDTKTLYSVLGFIMGLISDIDIESEHLRFLGQVVRTNIYAVMRIATFRSYKITISYLPADAADVTASHSEDANSESKSSSSLQSKSSPANDCLAPLDEPVPSDWQTMDDDFIQVSGLGLSHVSQDITFHPSVKLDDGHMMLGLIKSSITRRNLIKYWDLLEKGIGLAGANTSNHTSLIPCRAFRIEPRSEHSQIITLDGEVIPPGPLQGQIHPGIARVFGQGDC